MPEKLVCEVFHFFRRTRAEEREASVVKTLMEQMDSSDRDHTAQVKMLNDSMEEARRNWASQVGI